MQRKWQIATLALLPIVAALAGCGGPQENRGLGPEETQTVPSDTPPISPGNTCVEPGSGAADQIDSHGSTEPDQVDRDPHAPDDDETAC